MSETSLINTTHHRRMKKCHSTKKTNCCLMKYPPFHQAKDLFLFSFCVFVLKMPLQMPSLSHRRPTLNPVCLHQRSPSRNISRSRLPAPPLSSRPELQELDCFKHIFDYRFLLGQTLFRLMMNKNRENICMRQHPQLMWVSWNRQFFSARRRGEKGGGRASEAEPSQTDSRITALCQTL